MADRIAEHYTPESDLAETIAARLTRAGRDLSRLTTTDLAAVDEFHVRGRAATLEIARWLGAGPGDLVLDIGSGLGGPARTLAETRGCRVVGVDLSPAYCAAAATLSTWVGLGERVSFRPGDATALPFGDGEFDAAMTLHVGMNIAAKHLMYGEARRVLKAGGRFTVYDVLQGEGGAVHFPVPWAGEPSISHLATPDEMENLLAQAGFEILRRHDSSDESLGWFESMAARTATAPPPVTLQAVLGDAFPTMVRNQIANLRERRIRTVGYLCRA